MKLLENSSFEALSSRLCVEMGESRILGRLVSRPLQHAQRAFQSLCRSGDFIDCHIQISPHKKDSNHGDQVGSEKGELGVVRLWITSLPINRGSGPSLLECCIISQ